MTTPGSQPGPPGHAGPHGLKSTWSEALSVPFSSLPLRLEGEVPNLLVYGEIPKEIDGTFYRIMVDPMFPQQVQNTIPIEGDGNISAFRIHNGQVDMKIKYVDTERLKLERKANKRLFGLYRNPFTHHPCVRAAVDSTANTNLVMWAGHLLALKEVALPYAVDPDSLDTLTYDPFAGQVQAKTFTAHPKVDPFTEELVVFGYEARGLATLDIIIYALDKNGIKRDEQWIKSPWCGLIHDCAITENFIILVIWPFEADMERLKAGGLHWAWAPHRPATFIVIPRRPGKNLPAGWQAGESRVYEWDNCVCLHTAGAWESKDGKLYMESSRIIDNELAFFPPADGNPRPPTGKADFVRWEFDLSKPSGSKIPEPHVVLDLPSEFPRMDERFMSKEYEWLFLNVVLSGKAFPSVVACLDGLAMVNTKTGKTQYHNPGEPCSMQEPIFIPRSSTAPEGDGWVLSMVERKATNLSHLVLLDTRNFEEPVAIIQLPMRLKAQIHGNWVESSAIGERKSLVRQAGDVQVSGRGALEAAY